MSSMSLYYIVDLGILALYAYVPSYLCSVSPSIKQLKPPNSFLFVKD